MAYLILLKLLNSMIGLIWNIRGLGQHDKIQCLCDTIAKSDPDFIGFQETKKENISKGFLKAIDRFDNLCGIFCQLIILRVGSLWVSKIIVLK